MASTRLSQCSALPLATSADTQSPSLRTTDVEFDALLRAATREGIAGNTTDFYPLPSHVVPFLGGGPTQLRAPLQAPMQAAAAPHQLLVSQEDLLAAIISLLSTDTAIAGHDLNNSPLAAAGTPGNALAGAFSSPVNACFGPVEQSWTGIEDVAARSLSATLPLRSQNMWGDLSPTGGANGSRGRRCSSFDPPPPTMAGSPVQPLPPVNALLPSITTGSQCGRAHNPLYKTELCRGWLSTSYCRYGDKCQFAHGESELRQVPRHLKFKTKVCIGFATTGTCIYGSRCRFFHGRCNQRYQQDQVHTSPME